MFAEYSTKREGQLFERKSAKLKEKDIVNCAMSLANADGGILVVGIEDDGTFTGFRGFPNKLNDIKKLLSSYITPPLPYRLEEVPHTHADGQDDLFLVINLSPSEHLHVNAADEAQLRSGDESRTLTFEERTELEHSKGIQVFEARTVKGILVENLNETIIAKFGEKLSLESRTAEEILLARSLATKNEGEKIQINVAGVLLFCDTPELFFDRARIRVLWYEGLEEKTGSRQNLVKDEIINGNLVQQIEGTKEAVRSKLREFTRLDETSGKFLVTEEYPPFAWFEGVVNAVTHREYSYAQGADIQVKIFDDRIEIISPGNFPKDVRVDNIKERHFSRNPKIARAMADMGYVQELGEGVNRMFDEMNARGLPEPEFESGNGQVKLTLRNNVRGRKLANEHELYEKIQTIVDLKSLTEYERRVISYVVQNGKITTKEATVALEKSEDTARNVLKGLSEDGRGILLKISDGATDPKTHYVIHRGKIDKASNQPIEASKEDIQEFPTLF